MKLTILLFSIFLLQLSSIANNHSGHFELDNQLTSEQKKDNVNVKIFPNPCKNKKVTIETGSDLLAEIRFTNIAGKVILQKKMNVPTNKETIELNNVPNGIYLIQIITNNNKKAVKKLMVSSQ